jgi:hypothetical protein
VPFYGAAVVYNPTCIAVGYSTIGLNEKVKVYSWELSLANPLRLTMQKSTGNDWYSPVFEYDDIIYGHDSCNCYPAPQGPEGLWDCSCPFTCNPFTDP